MQEQFYIYMINIILVIFCFNGYSKGYKHELISTASFIVALLISVIVYNDLLIQKIFSIVIFFLIILIGMFLSFLNKPFNLQDKFLGIFIGILKYFTYLMGLTIIGELYNTVPIAYKENLYVRKTKKITKYILKQIKKYQEK